MLRKEHNVDAIEKNETTWREVENFARGILSPKRTIWVRWFRVWNFNSIQAASGRKLKK